MRDATSQIQREGAAAGRGAPDIDAAALGALGRLARGVMGAPGGDLSYGALKEGFREVMRRDPLDSLGAVVLGGAYLFYLAEHGKNPKVGSFWDGLVFLSTNLAVGYDDVFARTDAGKAIASFVMTFGAALSNAAFEPPGGARDEALEVNRAILGRLDAIAAALGASQANTPAF